MGGDDGGDVVQGFDSSGGGVLEVTSSQTLELSSAWGRGRVQLTCCSTQVFSSPNIWGPRFCIC